MAGPLPRTSAMTMAPGVPAQDDALARHSVMCCAHASASSHFWHASWKVLWLSLPRTICARERRADRLAREVRRQGELCH